MPANDFVNDQSKKTEPLKSPNKTTQPITQKTQEFANNEKTSIESSSSNSQQRNQQQTEIIRLQNEITIFDRARVESTKKIRNLDFQVNQLQYQIQLLSHQLKCSNWLREDHEATIHDLDGKNAILSQENESLRRQIHSANNSNNENRQPQPGTETTTVGLFSKKSINTTPESLTKTETQTATNFF